MQEVKQTVRHSMLKWVVDVCMCMCVSFEVFPACSAVSCSIQSQLGVDTPSAGTASAEALTTPPTVPSVGPRCQR